VRLSLRESNYVLRLCRRHDRPELLGFGFRNGSMIMFPHRVRISMSGLQNKFVYVLMFS
jgi:hypothetical protein